MGNPLTGLDPAILAQLLTVYTEGLLAVGRNQSYTINGRSLTRANMAEIKSTIGQIIAAQQLASGATTDNTLVSYTGL